MDTSLWEALDRIPSKDKWCKADVHLPSGRRCLLGAIANSQPGEFDVVVYNRAETQYREDVEAVWAVIREQYPDSWGLWDDRDPIDGVWNFNDASSTEYSDVRLVVEKAAVRRDEILS